MCCQLSHSAFKYEELMVTYSYAYRGRPNRTKERLEETKKEGNLRIESRKELTFLEMEVTKENYVLLFFKRYRTLIFGP
jgi:hypothetical protein